MYTDLVYRFNTPSLCPKGIFSFLFNFKNDRKLYSERYEIEQVQYHFPRFADICYYPEIALECVAENFFVDWN